MTREPMPLAEAVDLMAKLCADSFIRLFGYPPTNPSDERTAFAIERGWQAAIRFARDDGSLAADEVPADAIYSARLTAFTSSGNADALAVNLN